MAYKPLTDSQWELIEPHIPKQKMGRPRTKNREILQAILYMLFYRSPFCDSVRL
jgi:transposase